MRSALPSYGPGWDEAIRFGVDVTLLLENLARTPTERLHWERDDGSLERGREGATEVVFRRDADEPRRYDA